MSDIRYRKISVQIWNDERVERLSDDAKLGFVFVLTHPLMTGIGAARLSVPGLSAERGWDAKKGAKAFGEAFREGLLEYDEKRCLLWAPNFLKHNKPESPNVVKSWQWIPVTLPDCPLKYKIFQSVKAFTEGLSEDFAKALPEVFREGYRESQNTEQRTKSKEQRAQITVEDMSAVADPRPPVEKWLDWRKSELGQKKLHELLSLTRSDADTRPRLTETEFREALKDKEQWLRDHEKDPKVRNRVNWSQSASNWMKIAYERKKERESRATGFTTNLSDRAYDETKRRTGSGGGFTKIGDMGNG